jgi:DNA-binding NarL/FixJ family response regulator
MVSGIRIAVVGDSQSFTDTLAAFIRDQAGMDLVGTAATAQSAMHLLRETTCDVVTVELSVGGHDGLVLAQSLLHERPELAIIVVTAADTRNRMIEAIEVGARGWVSRTTPISVMDAIRGVAHGESRFPADALREVLLARMRAGLPHETDPGRDLTLREWDVLACLADGLTRAEIGQALHLSTNTVRTYVRNILRKLHVHSSAAAVSAAGRFLRPAGAGGLPVPADTSPAVMRLHDHPPAPVRPMPSRLKEARQ